jgi:hypothetical protein
MSKERERLIKDLECTVEWLKKVVEYDKKRKGA